MRQHEDDRRGGRGMHPRHIARPQGRPDEFVVAKPGEDQPQEDAAGRWRPGLCGAADLAYCRQPGWWCGRTSRARLGLAGAARAAAVSGHVTILPRASVTMTPSSPRV